MKKLFLLAGLPGVGKTTISRVLSKRVGAKIVDIDDFKRIDVDPSLVTKQIDPPEIRWSYYLKSAEYVFDIFETGVSSVIMDEVFHLGSLRSQLENLYTEHRVQVLWVEVRCPFDTVKKRLQSKSRIGHILSTEEALEMHILFKEIFDVFPHNKNNHIVVDNEDEADVDSLIESILKKFS